MYETLTTAIFATAPFWVLPFLGWFLYTPRPPLAQAFDKGDGLIYASVLLGPLIYVITKRYGHFNLSAREVGRSDNPLSIRFPYGGAFVIITSITCLISGFVFAETRKAEFQSPTFNHLGMVTLSYTLIAIATFIFFLVTAYSNMLEGLEKSTSDMIVDKQPREEQAFLDDWLESKS